MEEAYHVVESQHPPYSTICIPMTISKLIFPGTGCKINQEELCTTWQTSLGKAPLAQWIRRLPTEQEILGSIPGGGIHINFSRVTERKYKHRFLSHASKWYSIYQNRFFKSIYALYSALTVQISILFLSQECLRICYKM